MPDPRSVMKEFRFLDQKRQAEGLTADEELRFGELRDLVGGDVGGAKSRPGFDVTAAAARLRESLMPAGLRNRPPPTPEPAPEPIGEIEPPVEEAAADPAYAEQAYAPAEPQQQEAGEAYFDPGALAAEGDGYDPGAGGYDPNAAAYDPNAPPYDPNAPYDPSAAAYDPNAPPYDPNAPYDPSAAAYDPNAPPYDPNAPYDPSAAAYDPNAPPYDPNAPYDPSAAAYDPNAPPYDPGAALDPAAGAASAELAFDPSAPVEDPNAVGWADVSPTGLEPEAPSTETEPEETVDLAASSADTDWSALSADENPAGAAAPVEESPGDPAWAPAPGGEYDGSSWDAAATGEPGAEVLAEAPAATGGDLSPFPAAGWALEDAAAAPPPGPLEFGGYDDAAAPVPAQGAADLEALLPFDPAADAVVGPDMARAFGGEGASAEPVGAASDVGPEIGSDEFQATGSLAAQEAPSWQPETAAVDQGFELASGGSFDAAADAAAPEWAAPAGSDGAPWAAPVPGEDLAAEDPYAAAPAPDSGAAASLDFSGGELTSPDAEGADVAWGTAGGAEAPASYEAPAVPDVALPAIDLDGGPGFEAPSAGLDVPVDAAPPAEEELPTIDAADIIDADPIDPGPTVGEELPPEPVAAAAMEPEPIPEPEPAAPPVYAAEPPLEVIETTPEPEPAATAGLPVNDYYVHGVHRVVVHTLEGQVKRGVLENADLGAPELALAASQGGPVEGVPTGHVKAIFFMLSPGEQAATPFGSRVRVTFRDGRQVAGLSPDYREGAFGFFMTPADARTSTARIWVYAAAVKQVTVS